jgi:hypothetical protein
MPCFRGLPATPSRWRHPDLSSSAETEKRISLLSPPDQQQLVRNLLFEQCRNNLPFLENVDERIECFQFAALKLSEGKLSELDRAIALAKADWRDLLMAAGFGEVDIVRCAGNDGLPMFRPPRRRNSGGENE